MKKIYRGLSFVLIFNIIFSMNQDILASIHTESKVHGFDVELTHYNNPVWRVNGAVVYTTYKGTRVGSTTTWIGMTRSKQKASNGRYIDQVMVLTKMKGLGSGNTYGYSEDLTIKSTLPHATSLIGYFPESMAGMKEYNIGASVSSESVGITANTKVEQKALVIRNDSNSASNLVNIFFDYKKAFFRTDWNTFNTYAYKESCQRVNWTINTPNSKYTNRVAIIQKYEIYSGPPSFWAGTMFNTATTSSEISFRSPY